MPSSIGAAAGGAAAAAAPSSKKKRAAPADGDAASGDEMDVDQSGDWTCLRVDPLDGETFDELQARLKITAHSVQNFYKVIKTEKVSETKELAMFQGGDWTVGYVEVRKALGLPMGAISVKPKDLPADVELFVQSSSTNRKLKVFPTSAVFPFVVSLLHPP